MGAIGWVVMGVLAGWIASALVGAPRGGCLWNLVIGILGAFVGGLIYTAVTDEEFDFGEFRALSLVVATFGAIVLLLLINIFTVRRWRRRS